MVTRRDLGVGYLLGTGLGLIVSQIGYLLLVSDQTLVVSIGAVSAVLLAGSISFVGYWLLRSDFEGDLIWTVATWSAVGLSIPTLLGVVLTVIRVQPPLQYLFGALMVNVLAGGAVVGLLLGSVSELRSSYDEARELHQRNLVLNRVLRHNIRNDVNVLLGYTERLETSGADGASVAAIKQRAQAIVELSNTAREIELIETEDVDGPVDVASVVDDYLEAIRTSHDDVDVTADVPDEAWADVDPLFRSVLDNLLENAIKHSGDDPAVDVSVETAADWVVVRVADHGPGIPDYEIQVLDESESHVRHGSGLGLWLVKWYSEHYGGELRFEENEPEGTVVTLKLPAGQPPPPASGSSSDSSSAHVVPSASTGHRGPAA